ncbi:MAG: hypothetical protein K9K88_19195 [Desulfobacterales bacterium]|nr:hypothetical protein [Desulfobacterales bacterium]
MKTETAPAAHDHLTRRCPRLGGMVDFCYCRTLGEDGLPCFKVLDCWWETFDVVGFFRRNLSESDFQRIAAARPKPKITSILEIVEEAKRRLEE